jgi:hypothetical protein
MGTSIAPKMIGEDDVVTQRQASLLGSISDEAQLTLRFQNICAYVNICYETPSALTRLKRAVDEDARKQAELAQQKKVRDA